MIERLILVRHGETTWNARKVLQGQADIELSAQGQRQALELRDVVRTWAPRVAVCSDLLRARQTAAQLGFSESTLDARWREADLGQWTGVAAELLQRDSPEHYQRWRDGQAAPPGGESFEQLRLRVRTAIDALRVHSGNVLVVTHGGAIRAALSELLGLHPDRIVPVDPASATVIQMSPGPRLAAFNVYRHLPVKETTD
jgi:glucosyl-3-phosphoglycerate phosphatase